MTPVKRWRSMGLVPRYLVLIPFTIAIAFPFYWMLVTSLNRPDTLFDFPPVLTPQWQWQNLVEAWQLVNWTRYIINTVIVAGAGMLLVVATSALAGYAFASMNFPGKALVFAAVLGIYMVPAEVTIVPNYITLKNLGWLDTYQAQFVPFGASVFGIFLMRQFFLTLPRDLWEAAQLDGCSHLRFLRVVALPLAQPALVTVALFHFVAGWNAFLWPLIVTNSDAVRPIQIGVSFFRAAEQSQFHLQAAGALIATLPVLVIFLFAQKHLVGGIAATGIRG